MNSCARCHDGGEVWASLDIHSRYGNFAVPMLCRVCTRLLLTMFSKEKPMDLNYDLAVFDVDDIDDAEHPHTCRCPDCDVDAAYELQRDLRAERAS